MIKTSGNNFFEQGKIEEILDRLNIVELISGYVNLKRTGNNYKGLCPFHSEKTPSFVVSETKQMFHCFGCGTGGNAIKFYMEIEQKSFPEAVRDLAERTGVIIEENVISPEQEKIKKQRNRYLAINKAVLEFFKNALWNSKEGSKGLQYLRQRKLSDELIDKFNLGWSFDDWQRLKEFLSKKKVTEEEMLKLGLISTNQEGNRTFDKFRGRVMFPIYDVNGNVIAFGGRIIEKGEPKYLNSPDTPLFNKGRHLYALNFAKNEIRKKDYSLLVEGYMDVLICHQSGINNAVASLGTAFTPNQGKLLMRYSINSKIAYDGDEAGRKAAIRAIEVMSDLGIKSQAVRFPDGYDPDDFLLKLGKERFEKLLDNSEDPVIYKLEYLMPEKIMSITEKNKIIEEISGDIFKISSTMIRDHVIRKAAERLGLREDILRSELRIMHRQGKNNYVKQSDANLNLRKVDNSSKVKKEYAYILQKIKEDPLLIAEVEKRGGVSLFPEELQKIYQLFTNQDNSDIMKNLSNSHDQLISNIMLQDINFENQEKAFFEILNNLCCQKLDIDFSKKQKQLLELEKKGNKEELAVVLSEINEIIKNKDRIRRGLFN